ncbi:hypothetical protein [Brevundimonas nasdae]|uniref:hypothetical protein n=1 Tax=Brevundimonas nasdae TaxID=172043 RepID=UPI0028A1E041|nr:hypothetical protein [Brevundimonas nasdae]
MQKRVVIWYVESDWPEWLKIDPDFHPSYAHWLALTKEAFTEGPKPEPITVRVKEFKRWAAANNIRRCRENLGAYLIHAINRDNGTAYQRIT